MQFRRRSNSGPSYGWWCFVKVIGGKVIFNNHHYSTTTRRHQWNTKHLMKELGIKIDFEINTRISLDSYGALGGALDLLEFEITQLHGEILKGQRAKNLDRIGKIDAKRIEQDIIDELILLERAS